MARAKRVINAFTAAWKARDAIRHAQCVHLVAAACEYFMRISLMANIPHQFIFRRVENIMQSNGEFNHSQVGGEMAAGSGYAFNKKGA